MVNAFSEFDVYERGIDPSRGELSRYFRYYGVAACSSPLM
jgi:hypothetical protein